MQGEAIDKGLTLARRFGGLFFRDSILCRATRVRCIAVPAPLSVRISRGDWSASGNGYLRA